MSDGAKTDTSGVTGLRKKFFRYLAAAFGAVLTTSIYSFVDTVVVGQYEGETGTAAISCVTPIWNLFISFGILFGIGGSVMFSVCRGAGDERKSNEYFTSSLLSVVGVSAVLYVLFLTLKTPLLSLFGASENSIGMAVDVDKTRGHHPPGGVNHPLRRPQMFPDGGDLPVPHRQIPGIGLPAAAGYDTAILNDQIVHR